MNAKHIYSDSEIEFIKSNASKGVQWLSDNLGLPYESVRAALKNRKISTGVNCRFKKGQTPFNKGKKWDDYMSEENQKKSLKTVFTIGHLPHNTKSDNVISIRPDKRGIKYQFIRTSLSNWIPLHVFNWEKENGQVPKGYIVVFKDKNSLNADISNLEIIDRKEHMLRNTIMRYPEELRSAMKTLSKLKKNIKDHGKKQD